MSTNELVRRGVHALLRTTFWWGFGVLLLAIVNVAFWPSFEGSAALESFEDMGAALEAFGAQNMATPAGYLDGQMYALMLPLLLSGMAIAGLSAITAGDEDAGRMEVLLALPVHRRTVWLTRWFAGAAGVASIALATTVAMAVALPTFSLEEAGLGRVAAATAGCALLALFHGSVAFAAAGAGARRGLAAGLAIAMLLAGYLMALVLPLADAFAWARSCSPWHWALAEQPVSEGVPVGGTVALVLLTAALAGGGALAVERRDVRGA